MKVRFLKRLWQDERAFVISSELILLTTIAIIGLLVGLATYRDAVVQELADTGAAIGAVNQSYSIEVVDNGSTITVAGDVVSVTTTYGAAPNDVTTVATFNNYDYADLEDVCDVVQTPGTAPAGIDLNQTPINEGEALP